MSDDVPTPGWSRAVSSGNHDVAQYNLKAKFSWDLVRILRCSLT